MVYKSLRKSDSKSRRLKFACKTVRKLTIQIELLYLIRFHSTVSSLVLPDAVCFEDDQSHPGKLKAM